MATFVFTIPSNREELLNVGLSDYSVHDVFRKGEIPAKLEEARISYRDEGPNFILDYFDVYYSVLHHAGQISVDVTYRAYLDLEKAVVNMKNSLTFILEDKDNLNSELKAKVLNMLKMLLYIYTEFITFLENRSPDSAILTKGRKPASKTNQDNFTIDKAKALLAMNNVIQLPINLFWESRLVEEKFISMICQVCYNFLQNPTIKSNKSIQSEVFGLIGNMIKSHGYANTFVIRIVQSIRMYEHVAPCVVNGVQLLVEHFNCSGLVKHLIQEITEWQVSESTYQDNQGARYCSAFLTQLVIAIPALVLPEVKYLNRYLQYDSQPLRISIINVMSEVVFNVLTRHDLSEEETETRDTLLDVIIEHMMDTSSLVRSKVIQSLAKLQSEMALPLKYQTYVLEKVIRHLSDKGVLVRKVAIQCVTVFLSHNSFGSSLQLKEMEEQLAKKKEMLTSIEESYKEALLEKLNKLQGEWDEIKNDLKKAVDEFLDEEDDDDENEDDEGGNKETEDNDNSDDSNKENQDQNTNAKEGQQTCQPTPNNRIQEHLKQKQFSEAFVVFKKIKKEWFKKIKSEDGVLKDFLQTSGNDEVNVYMAVFHSIFTDLPGLVDEMRTGAGMTTEDVEKTKALENIVAYLEKSVNFLQIIDKTIKPMTELLFTTAVSDMQEAIKFFIEAYKFQIDNIAEGIQGMLKLMKYKEQERKDAVVQAFRTIYLETESKTMQEHTSTIVNRLIDLLRSIDVSSIEDMEGIISEWTAKGILDNSVIDMLWQYFTRRVSVTDYQARAATELLRMAALGRKTIIMKNIKVVSTVAFGEKSADDMLFLASCCKFLSVAGRDKTNINAKEPNFRIKYSDPVFDDLVKILTQKFFQPVEFYMEALHSAISFIYALCTKPTAICEKILKEIIQKMEVDGPNHSVYIIARFCQLIGFISIRQFGYLDDTVYKELKRRINIKESQKEGKRASNKDQGASASRNNKRMGSARRSTVNKTMNESTISGENENEPMEGAQAQDIEAEYIFNVCENQIVCGPGVLARFTDVLLEICKRPDIYDDVLIQVPAVTALIRYMLVSSVFCQAQIRLLFTIFEKTKFAEVKCSILIHCSDLLTHFPNVIEPWTPRLYDRLKDPDIQVRKTALFVLSNLVLRDMIRVHSHISEMVICLTDEDEEMVGMCKTFLTRLSQKQNSLQHSLPDIFSHLDKLEDQSNENLKFIMKYLFDLVDTSKKIESLVDRFCCKFPTTENIICQRNIAYCLSLMTYNDKALRKLQEKFGTYKHLLHDGDIYGALKQILGEAAKPKPGKMDLKAIVAEIETSIEAVFELDEDGNAIKRPTVPKPTKKAKNAKAASKKKGGRRKNDSDEDFNDDLDTTPIQKSQKSSKRAPKSVRKKPVNRKRKSNSSDDDDSEVDVSPPRSTRKGSSTTLKSTGPRRRGKRNAAVLTDSDES